MSHTRLTAFPAVLYGFSWGIPDSPAGVHCPDLIPAGLACPNAGLGQDLSASPSHHETCASLHPWPLPGGLGAPLFWMLQIQKSSDYMRAEGTESEARRRENFAQ